MASGSDLPFYYLKTWGESSVPPAVLATLVAAQHMRPFQFLPMLCPPVLLFSAYMNLNNYVTESAGLNAAWSGLYMLLAHRRKQPLMKKWSLRGVVRGTTMGLCAVNVVCGGIAYAFGKKSKDDDSD